MFKKTVLFFLLLLAAGCDREPYPLPKLSQNATILAFGDSLTYGTGASDNKDYPTILAEITSLQVINEGIPGEISRKGLTRLPGLLDRYRPKLLILTHGGNDMLKRIPRRETAANLENMIQEARQRNIAVVMLGVPKPGILMLESDEMYLEVSDKHQVPVELEALPAILSDNKLKSDAVHPNNGGYRKMAEAIAELLQKHGAL